MRSITLAVGLLVVAASQLIAVPVKEKEKEKAPTPIAPGNVKQLVEVGTLQRDAWRLDWVPGTGALAVLPWEDEIEVFNARDLKSVRKLAAGRRLLHFAFSRDGKLMASCENNTGVTIEDLKTGKSLTLDTTKDQPNVAFSPDGKWLATGGYGNKAGLWEVATGKRIRDFETDAIGGLNPVFSPDGKILALGNRNSDPRLFEASTGKLLHVLPKQMTHGIRFNPAGTIFAATYVDGSIGLWDVATGKLLHDEKPVADELYVVDWSPKGDLLVTAGLNAKIDIWDAKTLKPLKELDAPEWVIQARFSPDGSRLFTAGGSSVKSPARQITVWGLAGDK